MKKFILWLKSLYKSEARETRQVSIIRKKIERYKIKVDKKIKEWEEKVSLGFLGDREEMLPCYLGKVKFNVFENDGFINLMSLITGEEIDLDRLSILDKRWVYKEYTLDICEKKLYYYSKNPIKRDCSSIYDFSPFLLGLFIINYFYLEIKIDTEKQISEVILSYSMDDSSNKKNMIKYTKEQIPKLTKRKIIKDIKYLRKIKKYL